MCTTAKFIITCVIDDPAAAAAAAVLCVVVTVSGGRRLWAEPVQGINKKKTTLSDVGQNEYNFFALDGMYG